MKTKSIMDLRGTLGPATCQAPNAELADSLRAMHRAARAHYSPAGGLQRVSIVMEEWRLSHLIHAANALVPALSDEDLCAEVELTDEDES